MEQSRITKMWHQIQTMNEGGRLMIFIAISLLVLAASVPSMTDPMSYFPGYGQAILGPIYRLLGAAGLSFFFLLASGVTFWMAFLIGHVKKRP